MDYWILLWSLGISIIINLIFFIIAFIIKTDVFTDITYALNFLIIGIFVVVWKQNFSLIQVSMFVFYNLWAIRIGIYLLIRILKIKVDHRFDKIRENFWKFSYFWFLQSISVFLISIPTIFCFSINANKFTSSLSYYSLIFIFLAIIFLLIETIADQQKFLFYTKKRKKEFIDYGLWKKSRHPNYFGEIGFWYSMTSCFIFSYLLNNHNKLEDWLQILWLLSPIYLNLLIVFVSGIPILEKRAKQKFKNNKDYQNYIKETPILLFIIGKKGSIKLIEKLNYTCKCK